MLRRLFPRYHSRYSESPFGDWLNDFADWLVSAGYPHVPAHNHVRRLKQALERAGSGVVGPEGKFSGATLAKIFTSPRQQILFDATRRAFQRFLVTRGQFVTASGDRFSSLFEAYRRHLLEMRGLVISTADQHIATAGYFLAHVTADGRVAPRFVATDRRSVCGRRRAPGEAPNPAAHRGTITCFPSVLLRQERAPRAVGRH